MKPIVIVLGLVCAALAFGLFKSNSSAGARAGEDLKSIQSLSNQVSELRTRLALAQGTASVTESNLQAQLARRGLESVAMSNRIEQAGRELVQAQRGLGEANAGLAAKAHALAALEAERDELSRQLEVVPSLRKAAADAQAEALRILAARNEFERLLGEARLQIAGVERQLNDPAFLRVQLKQAEDASVVRKQLASSRPVPAADPRVRLELRPDGSVGAEATAAGPE